MKNLLEAQSITVQFGGLRALSDVSFQVGAGEVVGLIGPNGAGKSTMLGVLSGLMPAKTGRVYLDGGDISTKPPFRRAQLGMARTFQRLELWRSMSVWDNFRTAAEMSNRSDLPPADVADSIVERLELSSVSNTTTMNLSTGSARVVEVGRALAAGPRLMLLDEPSAGLDTTESRRLGALLTEIASEGVAILLVEHHVEMIMSVCDRMVVLEYGQVIGQGTPAQVQAMPEVQAAYLGVAL